MTAEGTGKLAVDDAGKKHLGDDLDDATAANAGYTS